MTWNGLPILLLGFFGYTLQVQPSEDIWLMSSVGRDKLKKTQGIESLKVFIYYFSFTTGS